MQSIHVPEDDAVTIFNDIIETCAFKDSKYKQSYNSVSCILKFIS